MVINLIERKVVYHTVFQSFQLVPVSTEALRRQYLIFFVYDIITRGVKFNLDGGHNDTR